MSSKSPNPIFSICGIMGLFTNRLLPPNKHTIALGGSIINKMNKKSKKLIIANWKMNPNTLREAKVLYGVIRTKANRMQNVQSVVCPPFVFISELQKISKGQRLILGAQDVFYEKSGAYTGEISASMLYDVGARYVIVGHSERRALGESDEFIAKKVQSILKGKMKAVLCVGEKKRDEGDYLHFLRKQVTDSLAGVSKHSLKNLIIAYEPIWAIGKGAIPDKAEDAEETILFIKKVLIEKFGKKDAGLVPVLYGGSVGIKNTESFLEMGGIDGLLIGRASLDVKQFGEILQQASSASNGL